MAAFSVGAWFVSPDRPDEGHAPSEARRWVLVIFAGGIGTLLVGLTIVTELAAIRRRRVAAALLSRPDPTTDLASITAVDWRAHHGCGVIVLKTEREPISLVLQPLERADRLAGVRLIREGVPVEKQTGWPEFCRWVALPLARSFDPPRLPGPGERMLGRGRMDVIFGLGTVAAAGIGWFTYAVTGEAKSLVIAFGLVPVWFIMRFLWPSAGVRVRDADTPPGVSTEMGALLFGFLAMFAYPLAVGWWGDRAFPRAVADSGWFAVILLAFCPFFVLNRRHAAAKSAWESERRAVAVAEWDLRDSRS